MLLLRPVFVFAEESWTAMKKKLSMLYILLAGSLWGSMGVYVRKMNAYGLSALEIVQIRITLSLIFVGVYLLLFHREYLKIRMKDLWCFIGTGLVSQLAFSWFDFTGMTITSLSVMSVLLATAPIFVMLLSLILFHEKLTRRKVLALLITFSGCFLVSGIGTAAQAPLKGILFGLASGFTYALYSIFSRYALQKGYSSWTINFYTYLTCSVGCAFLCNWKLIGQAVTLGASAVAWMIAMAFFTCFLAFILYTKGLEQVESSQASILASVEPIVATILGAICFQEYITVSGIIGIALFLVGLFVLIYKQ